LQVCREANISEVMFHRWENQLGQMKVSDAKRLKQLERENTELKKILAESLLENRVLEAGVPLAIQPSPAAQQAGLPKPKTLHGHKPMRSVSSLSGLLTPQMDKPRQTI
jgi:hypothetical protein